MHTLLFSFLYGLIHLCLWTAQVLFEIMLVRRSINVYPTFGITEPWFQLYFGKTSLCTNRVPLPAMCATMWLYLNPDATPSPTFPSFLLAISTLIQLPLTPKVWNYVCINSLLVGYLILKLPSIPFPMPRPLCPLLVLICLHWLLLHPTLSIHF